MLAPFPRRAVLAVVAVKSMVNLAVIRQYGWHWDELYYRVAGLHLQLGYVDFPPLTPVLARVSEVLFPHSLVGLRLFAIAAGAGVVALAALLAREVGGSERAQALAALAVAACPVVLGANTLFQTVSFDQLAWMGVLLVAARLLRTGDERLWLLLGAMCGVAVMTKYTAIPFLVALGIGFVCTPRGRAVIHPRRTIAAGALALVIIAPNLWWQVRHGWPSIGFYAENNASVREETSRATYLLEFAVIAGPVGAVLAFMGVRRLWRDTTYRALAIAAVAVVAIFFVLGGKSYYPAPIMPLLVAVGAVQVDDRRGALGVKRFGIAAVVVAVLTAPFTLPVVPQQKMIDIGLADARKDYATQIGWPELAHQVGDAFRSLPPDEQARAAVLTRDNAEAGAVDLYEPGLPEAASIDRLHRFWPPVRPDANVVITIGLTPDELGSGCTSFVEVGRIDNPAGDANPQDGAPIDICHATTTLGELWSEIRG